MLSLKQRRKELKLSLRQAAERLCVDKSTVARWESGVRVPNIFSLSKLADLYRCDAADLFLEITQGKEVE